MIEQLYNKIKPVGKKMIIAVDEEAKNVHRIKGTDKILYISKEYSWDRKKSAPTMGICMTDCGDAVAGDIVLIHHNATTVATFLDIPQNTGNYKIHSVESDLVFFAIRDKRIICLNDYMIAERLYYPLEQTATGLVVSSEQKQIEQRLKIVATPEYIRDFGPDDVIVCYKFSDYEVNYNDGEDKYLIRVRERDIVGIDHDLTKMVKKNPENFKKTKEVWLNPSLN